MQEGWVTSSGDQIGRKASHNQWLDWCRKIPEEPTLTELPEKYWVNIKDESEEVLVQLKELTGEYMPIKRFIQCDYIRNLSKTNAFCMDEFRWLPKNQEIVEISAADFIRLYEKPTENNPPKEEKQMQMQYTHKIPFQGVGQYKLNNEQMINLDCSACCQKSDQIASSEGVYTDWKWNGDGSIDGLGFKDHSNLFLDEYLGKQSETKSEQPSNPITKKSIASKIAQPIRWWFGEPLVNIGKKSVIVLRYTSALALIGGISYGGYYAVSNYDNLLDSLPTIKIESKES